MSSDRAPPERPDTGDETPTEEIDADRDTGHGLENITTEPGARRTGNIEMLVVEAQLVADGQEPDNPAIPVDTDTGEAFRERIEDTDLVPAWTRPWEGDGD